MRSTEPKSTTFKKIIFFFLMILPLWTITKLPFFMAFDPNGDTDFDKTGLMASVNLVHWIRSHPGYTPNKMKTPAANFFLVHLFFGITLLVLIALTLIKHKWRRKYGHVTFSFAILLGIHTIPAAWMHDLWFPFTFTCIYVTAAGLIGFRTLQQYDKNPEVCEKHLMIEHYIIAFGAWGAGFAEILVGIIPNTIFRFQNGYWQEGNFEGPHPQVGTTPYDWFPSSIGWTIYLVGAVLFWLVWPFTLVKMDASGPTPVSLTDKKKV